MGTRLNYLFDGTDGANATTASTGASDIQTGGNGSSIKHESDVGLHGTTGLLVHYGTATGLASLARFGLAAASSQVSMSVNATLPATNPTVQHVVVTIRSSSGIVGTIYRGSTGNFAFQPSAGTPTSLLSAATLGAVRNVRITATVTGGSTTAGSWTIKFYNGDTGVQLGTTFSASSQNLSANLISVIQLGTATSEGNSIVYGFEDLQVEEGTLTEIGPYVPSIPLDTPDVTIDDERPASTIGGSDGEVDFSWGAISGASAYEVAIADGDMVTTGFSILDAAWTGLDYTATGRAKGPFTVRVIAVP